MVRTVVRITTPTRRASAEPMPGGLHGLSAMVNSAGRLHFADYLSASS